MPHKILRIDCSARYSESIGRQRADELITQMSKSLGDVSVIVRDVAQGLPFIDHKWVAAKSTPMERRSKQHQKDLETSRALISELQEADTLLITCPIYNFQIPASLKAWLDLIVLPGQTFQKSPEGAQGLVTGKRAVIIFSSSETQLDGDDNFARPYLRHILSFIGVTDILFLGGPAKIKFEDIVADYLEQTT